MSAIEALLNSGGTNSVGKYTFVDADTLRDNEDPSKTYRLQGYDAPEIAGIKGGQWTSGTAGGGGTEAITSLAEKQGFTNLVPAVDDEGEPILDNFGRQVVRLKNELGQDFTTELLKTGVLRTGKYTTQEDIDAIDVANLWEEKTDGEQQFHEAAKLISDGIKNEAGTDLAFKKQAINEADIAAAPHLFSSAVSFRKSDRDIRNKALSPFSDSWEQGWIGVKEASYGMLNLIGETTGSETLSEIGDQGIERARTKLSEYGTTLTDWKEVKDVSSAFDYITNNAALSLPYMAISLGGAVAAPFTFGASLAAPASVYAGQTWNEQQGDNKNAGIAIGSGIVQAALDRIGIGFIFKGGVGSKKLMNDAINHLVSKGYSKEAAKQTVFTATRKEMAGFLGDVSTIAKSQITGKAIFKDIAKRGLISGGGEAVTEGLQEATGYTAANWANNFETFDFNKLNERVLAGVIAGGALGKTFSLPGSIYNAGAWADVAFRQAPADIARLSQAGKHAEYETQNFGRVKSIDELNRETRDSVSNAGPNANPSFQERIDEHTASKKGRSIKDQVFDAMVSAPALWRGATRNIFTSGLLDQSRSLRVLADMFGGQLQRTFSGSTYENAKHHKVATYKNMVSRPEDVFSAFNGGKRANRFKRGEISQEIYNTLRGAIDANGKFDPSKIPDSNPNKQLLINLQSQLSRLGDTLYKDQKTFNKDLNYLQNYLLRYKSFNKKAIRNNKIGFIQALRQEFPDMTESKATEVYRAITESTEVNDISEALDATQAAAHPGSHRKRSLNLADKDSFNEFMEKDIFANISSAAKSAARYTAQQEYMGNNNENIAQLLQQAQNEGVPAADINKIAKQLNDYFLAESGNYKRPQTEAGKNAQTIQRNFMMFTTLAGLPLATISSFVEAALSMRGLTLDQIFGKKGSLSALGSELGHTLWTGMKEVSSTFTGNQVLPAATRGKEAIQDLGYYEWDVGAATVTGATEINPWQQDVYEQFFKWTGLQGWTNYTRAVRASIAGDYMIDKIQIIFDNQGSPKTNEVLEAEESLRNIGINVQDVVAAYRGGGTFDPNSSDVLEKNFREGTFNFINDAVALPQSANRPLIYQDPRFALFTQFQGFIATFTANHIPKLWGEYVKRGSPAMKYNAFAIMSTMIMLGFASQYLKDLIKYGEPRKFGPDDHPFLNTSEYVQRGIRASGLLGTGERVLDQFFPLYEQRSDGPADWLWNTTSGESPALGYAKRAVKGTGHLLEGDIGRAAKEGSRFIPGAGVLNFFRDKVQEVGNNWNFKG